MDIHAGAAYLALAFYLAAAVASLLVMSRSDHEAELLDETLYRFLTLGFLFQTAFMALGAWYSFLLFGTFWRWDPIVSLATTTWLAYALLIHARLFFGWHKRRLALATLLITVLTLLLHKGVPYLGRELSYHVFDLELPTR